MTSIIEHTINTSTQSNWNQDFLVTVFGFTESVGHLATADQENVSPIDKNEAESFPWQQRLIFEVNEDYKKIRVQL